MRPSRLSQSGGAVAAKDYRRLATGLASHCTVHLYNRRGRPGGADLPPTGYTVELDVADLGAVLERTGADGIFGHSVGGFIASYSPRRL